MGPTRKDRCLDRIFTNFGRAVEESGTVPPLEVEPGSQGTRSDHRIAYVGAKLPRLHQFEWITYQYRYFNEESVQKFGDWLAGYDWAPLVQAEGSNRKAKMYQDAVTGAMEQYFPLITVRRKSTDCPWINNRVRKLISRRRGVYRREGRSAKWRRLKRLSDDLIRKRRETYLQSQRQCLLVEDARRNFFRNVKAFKAKERPKPFDVRTLFPGKTDAEVAGSLASYFNRISQEFQPLEPSDIPRTHDRELPVLHPYQVEGRIRSFKKPKSMVKGDIFPALMDRYAGLLAVPLADIFNAITTSHVWPTIWKQEFVTVIPKCRTPAFVSDLRNISCTMLPSKIYESYVLNWLSTEVTCKNNQYGGIKGCSVSHLLVELWDQICWDLEDARAATLITAIDYAKAFNRLSFQHCLRAFARKGASSQTISLLATFLSNRTMSVRVSNTWSNPLPVYGGVPQGSILGVLLFNIATDDLEDDDNDDRHFVYSSDGTDRSRLSADADVFVPSQWSGPGASDDTRVEADEPPLLTPRVTPLDPDAPEFVPAMSARPLPPPLQHGIGPGYDGTVLGEAHGSPRSSPPDRGTGIGPGDNESVHSEDGEYFLPSPKRNCRLGWGGQEDDRWEDTEDTEEYAPSSKKIDPETIMQDSASSTDALERDSARISTGISSSDQMSDESSGQSQTCLLYTSPSPRDRQKSRMPSSA